MPLASAQQSPTFDAVVVDVGNVGLTVTNAGFVGNPGIRLSPLAEPSFEYPLGSGVEHLFEAGLWVGARRADGTVSVRTGAVTNSSGYAPGKEGYEFAQEGLVLQRSTLPTSDFFSAQATSQQDVLAEFSDTRLFVPGTQIPMPDAAGQLGLYVRQRSYAWSFPFTEYFVVLEFEVENTSADTLYDVHAGLWHDLVVRNVVTTTDAGSDYFNKGGLGALGYPRFEAGTGAVLDPAPDSMFVSYAFNAGGQEETINTYGAFAFLGAEWEEQPGQPRFFHPFVAADYEADGYAPPVVNPRWWLFSSPDPELGRPQNDAERFRRMQTPYPNPVLQQSQGAYEAALAAFFERLRTDGLQSQGNWIGLTPVGPVPFLAPGARLTLTFAAVAAMKPQAFQGPAGKPVDTEESRVPLRNNVAWAQRTYAGEDLNYNGVLDPGEDANGNGRLDRYLIPEPPPSPRVRAELSSNTVTLFWDRSPEEALDPISGRKDFEGYRIYRSDPGDDRAGDPLGSASLVAQYDRPGNRTGFNNGLDPIRVTEEEASGSVVIEGAERFYRTFEGDTTRYFYRYRETGLLNGWQYAFAVTSIDEGDVEAGLPSFESGRTVSAVRAFPGTAASSLDEQEVGVYPNPFVISAAWDGATSRTQKLYFNGLPARARIRVFTLAGELVKEIAHDAASNTGDIRWFDQFAGGAGRLAGGEHAWDVLSENNLRVSSGLYLFHVEDLDTGASQTGKFVIIK